MIMKTPIAAAPMKSSRHGPWLLALSVGFAAVPFAFALIRAVNTGRDFRYFWLALAGLGGTALVMVLARYLGSRLNAVALSAAAFLIDMLFVVVAGLLIGTGLGPGLLVVGAGFAFCFAIGCLLAVRARS
jgi:hypothetical protein